MQLNDVHSAHCQACAVNHAADVTVQRNVVQFPLRRLSFTRVFLRLVAHFTQVRLAEQRVAVSAQFTVEADQIALLSDNQRVDFNQRQVTLKENGRQAHENFGELLNLLTFQTQFERQFTTLVRHRARQRIESDFVNQVWGLFRHFFDFHAAFGGGHKDHAAGAAVNHRAQVQLFTDIGRSFNQNLVNRLTVRICLVGYQAFAQPMLSKSANVFFTVNYFHTARFAAATSVNLTFHYPRTRADF